MESIPVFRHYALWSYALASECGGLQGLWPYVVFVPESFWEVDVLSFCVEGLLFSVSGNAFGDPHILDAPHPPSYHAKHGQFSKLSARLDVARHVSVKPCACGCAYGPAG